MAARKAGRKVGRLTRKADRLAARQALQNPLAQALAGIARDLEALGFHFAIIGGLAVSAQAEPRLTRDADLAVAVKDDEAAEALLHDLQVQGYRLIAIVEQDRVGRLATARLEPPRSTGAIVDLLFSSSGIETEIVNEAVWLDVLPGLELPVARIGHLLALKVLARDDRRRPQDLDDIHALLREADASDRRLAARALALIEKRGFHRNRHLVAAWNRLGIVARLGPRRSSRRSSL
jgi:predicted nucleotidyltransferase